MKMLGAQIDLATNHCFLATINRKLNLGERQNGLYLINKSELCMPPLKDHHPSFTAVAQKAPSFAPPPGLSLPFQSDHADSIGSHENDQEHGRSHHGVPSTPLAPDQETATDHAQVPTRIRKAASNSCRRCSKDAHCPDHPGSPSNLEQWETSTLATYRQILGFGRTRDEQDHSAEPGDECTAPDNNDQQTGGSPPTCTCLKSSSDQAIRRIRLP